MIDVIDFASQWLAAWTGNRPDVLLDYYSEDAFYLDPAHPQGLRGKEALRAYLVKLLRKNPDWVWTPLEVIPTPKGFVLKWKATIPIVEKPVLVLEGLDIVELQTGKISRNEVFFDRSAWLAMLV